MLKINKNLISRLKKRGIALALAGTLIGTMSGCSLSNLNTYAKGIKENGYTGVYDEVDNQSFLNILSVQDGYFDESCFLEASIRSQNISILVKTHATTYGELYKEIDFVKDLVSTYVIMGPIYLDIDELLTCNSLENGIVLAQEFVKKLEENGMYVSLMVSVSDYESIRDKFSHTDKCLRISNKDKELPSDQEYVSIFLVEQEEFYTLYDYQAIIESAGLNSEENFKDYFEYVVQPGDTLSKISSLYDISVSNIQIYNDLEGDTIYAGEVLVIPNHYQDEIQGQTVEEESPDSSIDRVSEDIYYKGIDVSEYQGVINWEEARDKINFAIIRIADAYNKDENGKIQLDSQFQYNIEECNRLGIPVGIYLYSRAQTEEEIKEEIQFILENVKDYNITLPIYRDLEGKYAQMLVEGESSRSLQVNLTAYFCDTIEKAGYPSGVYLHKKYLDQVSELKNKYSIWAQGGWYYSSYMTFDDMIYAYEQKENGELGQFDLTYAVNIFQATEKGDTEGLGITGSTYVDYNYVDQGFVNNLIQKYDKLGNVKVKK